MKELETKLLVEQLRTFYLVRVESLQMMQLFLDWTNRSFLSLLYPRQVILEVENERLFFSFESKC